MITETGNKEAGANSYCTAAFADQYHALYGDTGWAGDPAVKEKALLAACQSLDLLYGPKFASRPLEGVQSLLWPRYPFADRNGLTRVGGVPVELQRAQAELALMHLTGADLFPEGNTQGAVVSESVQVGEIATSTTYGKAGKPDTAAYEGFRKIDLLLWPLLKGRQSTTFMSR